MTHNQITTKAEDWKIYEFNCPIRQGNKYKSMRKRFIVQQTDSQ